MTNLTAMELAGNYPDNIQITSSKGDNNKYACYCYMLRDGEIHKLMISSQHVFDSDKDAEDYLHGVAKKCVEHFNKDSKDEG